MYFVTLLVVAMAAFLLMAPPIHHRLLFRHGEKPFLIRVGSYMAIGGMVCLGVGFVGALATAIVVTLWFALPLVRREDE